MCNDTTVSKLKNDFHYTLSKFSHELRNPLTLINSGLQMIASAHPEVKEYEHWDDVMDNLDYVKELLDELSAFNNAGHVKRENIDTCCYLRTILSSIKPTLDYLEITLETDIPDSLPSIALDRIPCPADASESSEKRMGSRSNSRRKDFFFCHSGKFRHPH